MALEVLIPRLGWNMEEGIFLGWLKNDGDSIAAGEPVFLIETDKATQEVEAIEGGVLRISPDAPEKGTTIPVGTLIGYVTKPGEDDPFDGKTAANVVRATPRSEPSVPARETIAQAQASTPQARQKVTPIAHSARPRTQKKKRRTTISPRAHRVAKELGIDWSRIKGSGRTGRIIERDIRQEAATPPEDRGPQLGRTIPTSKMRRLTAERMATSHHSTAPVTLTTEADATELVELRKRLKITANQSGQGAPSYQDLFVRVVARALEEHPELNSTWKADAIVVHESVNIGIAVDTEHGLFVPVLRDAHRLGLEEIASRSRELIDRARNGSPRIEDLDGGTFTITNLGMHGIDAFTPIINPPECAILGLGRIVEKPAIVDGMIASRDMITLSLTFDHRLSDGAPAARFLDAIRVAVEDPES